MTKKYTDEQQAVISDVHPFVSLVATAGSGKTHTLVGRVNAVRDRSNAMPGTRALALTFTNRAAAELSERTEGAAEASTFHGLAMRIKDMVSGDAFTVYDETDSQDVAIQVGLELGILTGAEKDRRKAADKVIGSKDGKPRSEPGLARYRSMLRRSNAVDFEMLIDDALTSARDKPFVASSFSAHHALLDEQQDADARQWELVQLLDPAAICMVGDPRQTIYTWRNADPLILLDRWASPGRCGAVTVPGPNPEHNYREWHAHALTANFRSLPAIVALSNVVAQKMAGFDAPCTVAARSGDAVCEAFGARTYDEECARVAAWAARHAMEWKEGRPAVMVLARSWRVLQGVRERLQAVGVAHEYLADGGEFWSREAARNVVRFLQLCVNPSNDWMTASLINWPVVRLNKREFSEARESAAREATPLCHVLFALHPEQFPFWEPSVMAEAAESESAGIAVNSYINDSVRAIAVLMASGRGTKAGDALGAVSKCIGWATDARVQGLPHGTKDFLRWFATRQTQDDAKESPIWLSTVHGVKGLEADRVAIMGLESGRGFNARTEEDRRLFYVAATRARDGLLCAYSMETRDPLKLARPGQFWVEAAESFGSPVPDMDEAEETASRSTQNGGMSEAMRLMMEEWNDD